MKTVKHVTAGCFLVRNVKKTWEIIVIKRHWSDENVGWVAPKGHVEKGETLEEAAIRETTEETGYKNMNILQPLETLDINYKEKDISHQKLIHYYLAELIDDEKRELQLSEDEKKAMLALEWLPLHIAEEQLKFDDEREIMKKVRYILDDKSL